MSTQQSSQDPAVLRAIIEVQKEEIKTLQAELLIARSEKHRDELTGLPKRAKIMEAAQNALGKSLLPASMIFLDLNRFKEINDTLGHSAGDSLLVQFAQFLREQKDSLGENAALVTTARLGGDEFAIFMAYTGADEVQAFVDATKQALAKRIFIANGARISLCSAMGVATTGHGISTVTELLHRADESMYADKKSMAERGEITKVVE